MKNYYLFLAAAVLLISTAATAQQVKSESGPAALTIVLDSAWSNEHEMSDYISLSRQGIASLNPGDYVEIIIAASGKPKIRAAQFIKSGDTQEFKNITTSINKVMCPIFSDVDISKAVEMAFKRLVKSNTANSFAHVTVIVFSDGKVNDSDVCNLRQLSKQFKQRNWSLCITGTYHTNKKLLVAANQGDLKFSLVSDANPVMWIKTQRELTSKEPTIEQSSYISGMRPDKNNGKSRVNIETKVSITDGPGQNDQVPPAVAKKVKLDTEETKKPAAAVTKLIPEKPEPVRKKTIVKPKPAKTSFKLSEKRMWLIPIAIIFVVAVLFALGLFRANKFKSDIDSRLKNSLQKSPGTLIAKINGQTHTLGRQDRIGTINIGSGPNNTIRIPDKSISDRHIRIFRKGSDLFLQNIGKTAVTINSAPVKPRSKQRLTIPSTIEFNGKNRINLTLVRPKPVHQVTNEENKNGTE